jgi:anti-sigma factor RsiW
MTAETRPPCRDILEHLTTYLDGELDATACSRIEAHCEGCAGCARVVAGLRESVGLCRQAASAPLPEGVRALAIARVQGVLEAARLARTGDHDADSG